MTRPKTYGEFADTNEYTRVDERLRDREISEDAWRILNMHKEIPQNVKTHFGIKDETVACVDYYDERFAFDSMLTAKNKTSTESSSMNSTRHHLCVYTTMAPHASSIVQQVVTRWTLNQTS